MNRIEKNTGKKKGTETNTILNMSMSINYGDVIASVKADENTYVATITGKMREVEAFTFHYFVMRFIKSIEKASNPNDPI